MDPNQKGKYKCPVCEKNTCYLATAKGMKHGERVSKKTYRCRRCGNTHVRIEMPEDVYCDIETVRVECRDLKRLVSLQSADSLACRECGERHWLHPEHCRHCGGYLEFDPGDGHSSSRGCLTKQMEDIAPGDPGMFTNDMKGLVGKPRSNRKSILFGYKEPGGRR